VAESWTEKNWALSNEETIPLHNNMREAGEMFMTFLDQTLPDGRAKSTAMTKFQECTMWANFAIAEQAPVEPAKPPASEQLLLPTELV
jgi:hypothetical protein